jgi:hypothetical protein
VAPLYAGRYLPFFDYPAHLAVPAALRLRPHPETQIAALWSLDLGVVPNCLHYAFTYLVSFVMPLEAASRLFVALFCVAALPPAVAFLLRAFGRDPRLALLAIPLAWNRCLWYGFIGFCAALPLSCLALALLMRDLERPSARRETGLALLFALLPLAHFFATAVTGVIAAALLVAHARAMPGRRLLRSAAPLAAAPAVIAPWFIASLRGGPHPAGGALHQLFAARPALADYVALLKHWFMDAYTGHLDDALAVVMILTVAVLHGRSGRSGLPRREATPDAPNRVARAAPLAICALLAALYLLLPFELAAPFRWWGMNVRVLPILFIWLLVAAPPGRLDGLGRALLAPVTAATAAFLVYVAVDIHGTFNGAWGMAGLDDVLVRVPPGAKLLGLYTDYRQYPHYAHYPFHYASSYAVVRGGGVAAPFIPIPQSWTNPRAVPPYPPAGDAAFFRFDEHAPGYTHFLVRTCAGTGCVPDPLAGQSGAREIAASGAWRLYARADAAPR